MKRAARGLLVCSLLVFGLITTQGFAAGKADRATCPSGMALIPAGRYVMGQGKSENDVKAFCLDITEVRVADYTRFSSVKRQSKGHFVPDKGTCLGDSSAQFPVNCVDWSQATAFCGAQGKRLPTEEEWEWAARGTTRSWKFPWGNEAPWESDELADGLCWALPRDVPGCTAGTSAHDVSPEGVRDLYGSVVEWTSSVAERPVWRSCAACTEHGTVTERHSYEAVLAASYLGFRCAAAPAAPATRAR